MSVSATPVKDSGLCAPKEKQKTLEDLFQDMLKAGPVRIMIEHADASPELPGRTTDAFSTEEPAANAGAN